MLAISSFDTAAVKNCLTGRRGLVTGQEKRQFPGISGFLTVLRAEGRSRFIQGVSFVGGARGTCTGGTASFAAEAMAEFQAVKMPADPTVLYSSDIIIAMQKASS